MDRASRASTCNEGQREPDDDEEEDDLDEGSDALQPGECFVGQYEDDEADDQED